MDTDIEILKSFGSLLHLLYFVGSEGGVEAGFFGVEKGVEWLKLCLYYIKDSSFLLKDGSFDILTLPKIMNK